MNTHGHHLGFRVLGPTNAERRLIEWPVAFQAYAECSPLAKCDKEAYLSAFTFATDFKDFVDKTAGTAGFTGSCFAPYVWFDIDREGHLDTALADARRLGAAAVEMLNLNQEDILVFFSGFKGFHFGIPTTLWGPRPGTLFHRTARRFAEIIASTTGKVIDAQIYDKVHLFRAPNSRHPKTGLYKHFLSLNELLNLQLDAVLKMAERPDPFELPGPTVTSTAADRIWGEAVETVESETAGLKARIVQNGSCERLTRSTLDFIQNGATVGERNSRLYAAAVNLAGAGADEQLTADLLTEVALNSGLPPTEVQRTIENGWHRRGNAEVRQCGNILDAEVIAVEPAGEEEGGQ